MPSTVDLRLKAFASALLDPAAGVPSLFAEGMGNGYAVHRNGALSGLVSALGDIFPTLRRLIGAENFRGLATLHARAHPPVSPVLSEYGADFATFLEGIDAVRHLPFLPDVARVERAWLTSFHAADAAALRAETLAGLSPEALASAWFELHPAAQILELNSAAVSIVQLDRRGDSLEDFDPSGAETGLVSRPQHEVRLQVLARGEFAFLQALSAGKTLQAAAESATRIDPGLEISHLIRLMIDSGAFLDPAP